MERATFISNGVDTDRFKGNLGARSEMRKELGIDDDSVVIICPRRIVPKCGIIYFAESLAYLNEGCKNYCFTHRYERRSYMARFRV